MLSLFVPFQSYPRLPLRAKSYYSSIPPFARFVPGQLCMMRKQLFLTNLLHLIVEIKTYWQIVIVCSATHLRRMCVSCRNDTRTLFAVLLITLNTNTVEHFYASDSEHFIPHVHIPLTYAHPLFLWNFPNHKKKIFLPTFHVIFSHRWSQEKCVICWKGTAPSNRGTWVNVRVRNCEGSEQGRSNNCIKLEDIDWH